ncbi:glycosyltransferase family 32 protein [Streptococcus cristatus]
MIPKIIHYCWFGGNPIPEEYQRYIESWRKFYPEFEIKRWDETNFDVSISSYCLEAYREKQWAFVSDFARLYIIYNYGGIYLDTDVEVIKDLTPLIENGIGFIGFQNSLEVNSGLGFAAAPENQCVKSMLDVYENRKFVLEDGSYNKVPCPAANTVGLLSRGLKIGITESKSVQNLEGLRVYPEEFFNPLNADTQQLKITKDSYTIHHYTASWLSSSSKNKQKIKKLIPNFILKKRVMRIAKRDIKRVQEEVTTGRSKR